LPINGDHSANCNRSFIAGVVPGNSIRSSSAPAGASHNTSVSTEHATWCFQGQLRLL